MNINHQADGLADADPALSEHIPSYQHDKIALRDAALAMEAEEIPGYELLRAAIKTRSRLAIRLSTRV